MRSQMVVRKCHWKLGRTIQSPGHTILLSVELQRQNGHSCGSGRHTVKLKSISGDQSFVELAMLCIRLAWDSSLFPSLLFLPFGMEHAFCGCSTTVFCVAPQNSPVEVLIPNVLLFGCQDFRRKWGHGNSAIIRRDMKVSLSLCRGRTLQGDAGLQTRDKPSMLTPWSLTSSLLRMRNKLLFKPLDP